MIARRIVLAAGLALPFIRPASAQSAPGVVVVGGGFGGATVARFLRHADPRIAVTLVEANASYVSCPFSNEVIAGLRDIALQTFDYAKLAALGVRVVEGTAIGVDATAKSVRLQSGESLSYDRLVLSPGVDMDYAALPGYSADAAETTMPHAWKAGPQTLLLRRQLEAMQDGGVVVISAPANPYRCPPGPYERASLIGHYLATHKPKSKLLLLDAKDVFSKQKLFQQAWAKLYPDIVQWVSLSDGGRVNAVDAATRTFKTDFDDHRADVANVIPPQRAGRIAVLAGVADKTGWCPVDPASFESRLVPGIHVVGDAIVAGAMPKAAFAANAQAKVCAYAVAALLAGEAVPEPILANTCYSLAAPGYAFSVAGVYRPKNGVLTEIEGAGGPSPLGADSAVRAQEAVYAEDWYAAITGEVWG